MKERLERRDNMFFRHLMYYAIGYVCLQYGEYLMPDMLFYRKMSAGGYYSTAQSLNDFFMLVLYRPIPVFLSLFFYAVGIFFIRYVIIKRLAVWRNETKRISSAIIHLFLLGLGVSSLWIHFTDSIVRTFVLLLVIIDLYRFIVFLSTRGKNYNSYGI